jgi:hypothetical protein
LVLEGPGSVASSPNGIDCRAPGTCSATFSDGADVSLTATPAAGATFAGWGGACSGSGGCSLVLSADRQVLARFAPPRPPPPPMSLSVSVSGSGVVNGAGINCGLGATTCRTTVAAGTSVALTASPAGHVRFMGWSGACSGASSPCSVTVNADSSVGASFEDEVRVIQPNDGRSGNVLAINSTQVFFLRYAPQGWEIWSAGKAGGEAVRLVGGYASYMVADDGYLYWTDGLNLYSMPATGGSVALLASASAISMLALDADGALYWTTGYSSQTAGSVHRMQNRIDTVLVSGQYLTALAVDASFAWFANKHGPDEDGLIRRVPKNGGAVEDVANCQQCFPVVLRVDANNFYYRNRDGDTWARRKDGGPPILLSASNAKRQWSYSLIDLEVNASVVWWNWGFAYTGNGIYRANADGSGWTAVDTGDDTVWAPLRVDDTAIYYFHGGALIKRLK